MFGSSAPPSSNGIFGVLDGHGGRAVADYVCEQLPKSLAKQFRLLRRSNGDALITSIQESIKSTFLSVDASMSKSMKYSDCGSTAAIALIVAFPSANVPKRHLFLANVGDAQAFLATDVDGSLRAQSLCYPHVATDPSEQLRIRQAGGKVFFNRVQGSLAVSRAFGDHSLKKSGVVALPHQSHVALNSSHRFLIIACDGLWDVIDGQGAIDAVTPMYFQSGLSALALANAMAKHLVDLSIARDTTDNVTVVVVLL